MISKIIDVHSHFTTKEYLNLIARHGASLEDGFPLPQWNAQDHLALMDECNIEWTLLSVSSPQPYFAGFDDESVKMCRHLNESVAKLKQNIQGVLNSRHACRYPTLQLQLMRQFTRLMC